MSLGLKIAVYAVLIIAALIILGHMVKARRGGRAFILSALQGVAAVFAVSLLGMVTTLNFAVNWYTIGAGMVLGIPGVISVLILNLIFK